jgi:hypothetical protein
MINCRKTDFNRRQNHRLVPGPHFLVLRSGSSIPMHVLILERPSACDTGSSCIVMYRYINSGYTNGECRYVFRAKLTLHLYKIISTLPLSRELYHDMFIFCSSACLGTTSVAAVPSGAIVIISSASVWRRTTRVLTAMALRTNSLATDRACIGRLQPFLTRSC